MIENSAWQKNINNLLSRQEYLVVQANDLAKAFGNLKSFEHKLLDFCFSYVTLDNQADDMFETTPKEVLNHFGLVDSGENYKRIVEGFKKLNENTALYFLKNNGNSLVMSQLFQYIEIDKKMGIIKFQFSRVAAPYIFQLKSNFYSFKLRELSLVKSKYTLTLMKLWESNRYGNSVTATIEGSLEEFKLWFLGSEVVKEKGSQWTAARFKQQVLLVAMQEIEDKFPGVAIEYRLIKNGRKVIGYQIQIHDHRTRR